MVHIDPVRLNHFMRLDVNERGIINGVDAAGELWGFGKYQNLDPGWAQKVELWMRYLLLPKHGFNNWPSVITMPDSLRIAIAGDWATGDWRTPGPNPAPSTRVATQIKAIKPDLTIHLGDVYYAGSESEERSNLVGLWPIGTLGALTLNSNHEMYGGAWAYFDSALASKVFALQNGCSYFALENSNWVIIGLDTAYFADEGRMYDFGLLDFAQLAFLKAQSAKGKRVVLLTHHPGLTLDGTQTLDLWNQVLGVCTPTLWLWGHTHAGAVYVPRDGVLAVCCGHGGIPWGLVPTAINSKAVMWCESQSAKDPDVPKRVLNGFVDLSLSPQQLRMALLDENGLVAYDTVVS
jgi:hypothetical protein